MDEERPLDNNDTVETPSDNGPEETKRPSGLIIGGILVVMVLIIAGLFLPPISLGQRLGLGGSTEEETVDSPATEIPEQSQTEIPGAFALSTANQAAKVNVKQVAATDMAAEGISALPNNITLQGNTFTVDHDQTALNGQVALNIPAGTMANSLDLYGWDGAGWRFVPSQIDSANQQIVSKEHNLYKGFALGQQDASAPMGVGADLTGDQTLPPEVVPALTEVAAGALTLVGNGDLQGEVTAVPDGAYSRYLRVTNVSGVIDQASLAAFLSDPTAQSNQINALVNTTVSGGYAGVNLDFQGIAATQKDAFTAYVTMLSDALSAQGLYLALTLATPQETGGNWDSGGQDWAALGPITNLAYVQMPLDPTAYGTGGTADLLMAWATRQIDRSKLVMLVNAGAIDRIGETYIAMSNETALANFGEMQFVQGGAEVAANSTIEVILSGSATPLEWDGTSLTYTYSYEKDGQTHDVWLGNPAALAQHLTLATNYNVRGVAVNGLGEVTDGAGYASALSSAVGAGAPPETTGAAIVWTVQDDSENVLASESGSSLSFTWEGSPEGTYSINADFALGDAVAPLGSLPVVVGNPAAETEEEAEEPAAETEEETVTAEDTTEQAVVEETPSSFDPGDADAVTNANANVRTGPGLGYGLIAGGATAGTKVQLLGRSSDSSWLQIKIPAGQEGWIFASLLTVNNGFDISSLEVVEVEAPAATSGGDSGSTSGGTTAPPPVVAPVSNAGFELGGQAFGAPYGMMSYAGMTWIKRQHKWGQGNKGTDVAGIITEAHNAGFKILLSMPGANLYPSSIDFNAYIDFLGQVASLPDPPDAIEIWNEQNIDREWPVGSIDPSAYVTQMLAPAYNAIKSANGNVMVISGAPAPTGFFGGCSGGGCDDQPYMAAMAAAGAANYMDCIGIHYNEGILSPNQTSGDPRTEHYTRYFWGMVDAYYNAFGGSRQLCFTELGYLTPEGFGGGLPGGFAWAGNVTVAQQAQWLAEATSLSASSGKVRMLIVWNIDSTTWGDDPQAGYAIIRPGGSCPACESLRGVMGGG